MITMSVELRRGSYEARDYGEKIKRWEGYGVSRYM